MLDAIVAFFTSLFQAVRLADLFDIALVSAFLYAILLWLRRSASRRAIFAVSIFVGIYILASLSEMYLTEMLFQALFVVFAISAIIVFQSDIRRAVERLGTWRLSRRSRRAPGFSRTIDTLVEAAARLAATRTGALIAIRGSEPWDLHHEGGLELGGLITPPLLYSICDPGTPGHDGAILVEGDRITRFGVHLPLSTNLREVGDRGTRHTAALGLSEQCDALVVVVSEERGAISVAEGGRLRQLSSPIELKDRLEGFWRRHHGRKRRTASGQRHSPKTALLAASLAVLLWLLFVYRSETVYRTFVVPIELRNLQTNAVLEEVAPIEARVTLSGSERAFRLLSPASLIVSLDLSGLDEGTNRVMIRSANLKLPSNLSLYHVDPHVVQVRMRHSRPTLVPVQVRKKGALPDTLELVNLRPTPERVGLILSGNGNRLPRAVPTEPIDLGQISRSSTVETRLVLPETVRLQPGQSQEVTVQVEVRRKPRRR